MSILTIRTAGDADPPTLARLSRAAFTPLVAGLGYRPSPLFTSYTEALDARFVLIAEYDAGPSGGLALPTSNAVGYAALRPRPCGDGRETRALSGVGGPDASRRNGALYVEALAVAPGAQRRGVGRALMAAIEALATQLSLPQVQLHTDPALKGAVRFYQSVGFTAVGKLGPGVGPGPRQMFAKATPTLLAQTLKARSAPLRKH